MRCSGLRVSPLTLGAMGFGEDWGWGSDPETSHGLIDVYLDAGGVRAMSVVGILVLAPVLAAQTAVLQRAPGHDADAVRVGHRQVFALDRAGQ